MLVAHLKEARRPIEAIEGDAKRLTEQLAAKSAAFDALNEESDKLRAWRSNASAVRWKNANSSSADWSAVSPTTPTSWVEFRPAWKGWGSVSPASAQVPAGVTAEWAPELIRIDAGIAASVIRWAAAPASAERQDANYTSIPHR